MKCPSCGSIDTMSFSDKFHREYNHRHDNEMPSSLMMRGSIQVQPSQGPNFSSNFAPPKLVNHNNIARGVVLLCIITNVVQMFLHLSPLNIMSTMLCSLILSYMIISDKTARQIWESQYVSWTKKHSCNCCGHTFEGP